MMMMMVLIIVLMVMMNPGVGDETIVRKESATIVVDLQFVAARLIKNLESSGKYMYLI